MFKKVIATLIFSALAFYGLATETIAPKNSAAPLAGSQQMLLVTSKDWDTIHGVMRRFERANETARWKEVGLPFPVVVGRNGLGWGRGLNQPFGLPGPVKKEGDGKSPAGIFRLSSAFGLAAPDAVKNIRMPYRQLTDEIECVDDEKSAHYNSIVQRDSAGHVDWNSSEKMREVGEQYQLGIVVDHNTDPRQPGGGSCIFIHIWNSPDTGTSGCTAMTAENIKNVITWLNPAEHPVLVQMPEPAFKKLKKTLKLP